MNWTFNGAVLYSLLYCQKYHFIHIDTSIHNIPSQTSKDRALRRNTDFVYQTPNDGALTRSTYKSTERFPSLIKRALTLRVITDPKKKGLKWNNNFGKNIICQVLITFEHRSVKLQAQTLSGKEEEVFLGAISIFFQRKLENLNQNLLDVWLVGSSSFSLH